MASSRKPVVDPDRIKGQFKRQSARFTETTFLAALTGFRGNMQTGNLDLTLSVGPGEKDHALSVTDAPGELLLVTVERVSARRGRKREAASAGGPEPGEPGVKP